MIAYKSSDVKLSWTDSDSGGAGAAKVCGYVKEGEGNAFPPVSFYQIILTLNRRRRREG